MTQCSTKHGDNGQENHAEKVLLCKQVQNKGKAFPKVISSMYGKHVADTSTNFKSSKGVEEFCILD